MMFENREGYLFVGAQYSIYRTNNTNVLKSSTQDFDANDWIHVVMTLGTDKNIYIDGVNVSSNSTYRKDTRNIISEIFKDIQLYHRENGICSFIIYPEPPIGDVYASLREFYRSLKR